MTSPELLSYITTRLSQGATQEEIRQELTSKGWNSNDIDNALNQPSIPSATPIQPSLEKPPSAFITKLKYLKFRYFHNSLIPIVILIIALILTGGGGGFYLYYQSPEQQFKRLFEKLENISTVTYNGNAKITISLNQKQQTSHAVLSPYLSFQKPLAFSVNFKGQSDLTDRKNPRNASQYNLDFTGSIFNITAQFETIYDQNRTYLKVTELPDIGYIDTRSLIDQWIELEDSNTHSSPSVSYRLTREDEKKLLQVLKEKQIVTITQRLSDKKVNNISSSGYAFTIPKEKLPLFISEYKAIISPHVGPQTLQDIDEAVKILASTKPILGELWIDKWSSYPTQIIFTIENDDPDQFVNVAITSTFNFSRFNQPVAIQKPASTKTLSQLMEEFSVPRPSNSPNPSASASAEIMSAPSDSSLLFLNTLIPLLTY